MIDDGDALQRYKRMLDEARTALEQPRELSQRDRDYFDGKQLTPKQRNVLRRRKQPETIRNRIGPAIDGMLGILEQAKVDPRAYPRNPQDEDASDVATKCLQFVADKNRFHKLKLDCADNHLVEGACAAIIEADENGDVRIQQIRFEEFFYDPFSRQADYSDARYMGVGKWMYADVLASIYPKDREAIMSIIHTNATVIGGDMSWEDKPDTAMPWIDRKMRRLMVVEMYHRENDGWNRCVFCAAGVLEKSSSPYLDDDGSPMNPIEASSCYVDRDLARYGLARRMISLQDELNARASRSLHLLNSRQLKASDPENPPDASADTARTEAARADGVLPTGYDVVATSDMAQGNLAIMQEVSQSLDRLAPTPAVLGRTDGASQSGRSRLVLQQAGMTEIARPLGRLEDWENRVYRQVWLRCKQFWTDQKFIRVTDDEGAPEFLQINEPVYLRTPLVLPDGSPAIDPETGQPMTEVAMVPQPVMGPDGQPVVDPTTGQPTLQPQPVVVGYDNRIADMDMDIVVDTVPDTANLAAEQFQTLSALAQAYGPEAVPFEDLVELSSLPDKRKWRERREARQAEQQNPQAQAMQQEALMLAARKEQAAIAKDESSARLNDAKANQAQAGIVKDAAEVTQMGMNAAGLGEPSVIEG